MKTIVASEKMIVRVLINNVSRIFALLLATAGLATYTGLSAETSSTELIPNDEQFTSQWNLTTVDAPKAWTITSGSSNVVIAA